MTAISISDRPHQWWAFWFRSRRHDGEGFVTYGSPAWPSYATWIVF